MDSRNDNGPLSSDVAHLCRVAQTPAIPKTNLQTICVVNGLPKTGNKAALQRRIVDLIKQTERTRDRTRFYEIHKSIYDNAPIHSVSHHPPPYTTPSAYSPPTAAGLSPYTNMAPSNGYAVNGYGTVNGHQSQPAIQQSFHYQSSPFYEMKARIGEVRICESMAQHRQTVNMIVRLQEYPALQTCVTDPSMRVMAFCAAANTGVQDICFPYQSELKVNGGEVKANLRGLKNKPGSTRPVDITDLLRFKPATYANNVEFTYALTTKAGGRSRNSPLKFYFGLYVCKVHSVEGLVDQIKKGRRIGKTSVIQEITKKASDPDVVATSQNLSLKCPLSYMRLNVPCRGLKCSHIQCFDATSYLQLQEQGPQWLCPICNNAAPFNHLAVDEYVLDILTNTPKDLEQVTIEPDGKWSTPTPQSETRRQSSQHEASLLDDDDLILGQVNSRTTSTPIRSGYSYNTPAQDSREASSMPRSGTSSKRPAAEVIDLTLSDDEDNPPRPTKRQNTSNIGYNPWIT